MSKIWKYTLPPHGEVEMQAGANVLSVAQQGQGIVVWAVVDPMEDTEIRQFDAVPTGGDLPEGRAVFYGTVSLDNGLVFHIFEKELEQ